MTLKPSQDTLDRMAAIVGESHVIRVAADMAGYMREWRDIYEGVSPLVVRPSTTEQVSRILALAHETHTGIVPQGGNTGLAGGQIPRTNGHDVLLSLDRMTRIVAVSPDENTLTAEAGATLKAVQDAAEDAGRLFPLSLASEGSARIGGNLSTNAGGVQVLHYGNARELCLGLEVVLADGRVLSGLSALRKDNTGYDLRNLFIGAEDTLGIITKAVLKLFPKVKVYQTAFIAVPSPEAAVSLLSLATEQSSGQLTAFELLPELGLQFTQRHMGVRRPLTDVSPWYVLAELSDAAPDSLLTILEAALETGLATDAALAASETQRKEFWAIRENMSEAQKFEGGSIKHDVSVPVSKVPQFLTEAAAAVDTFLPDCRFLSFGHMGDGNIHFNVSQPLGMDKKAFLDLWEGMNDVVFAVVTRLNGSISAEHGIGQLKRQRLLDVKTPLQLELMRGIKALFDPRGILNPGKVLPP